MLRWLWKILKKIKLIKNVCILKLFNLFIIKKTNEMNLKIHKNNLFILIYFLFFIFAYFFFILFLSYFFLNFLRTKHNLK